MIHTAWPTLAILLLAAGIFSALERGSGWRFFSVLPPVAHRALATAGLRCASVPFHCAPVRNRFTAHIGGAATIAFLAARYSRSPASVGIPLSLPNYILGTGFGLLVATALSTPAPV